MNIPWPCSPCYAQHNWCYLRVVAVKCFAQQQLRLFSRCSCFLSFLQEKVRLRYRLSFTLGDQPSTEVGEVDQFPPVEQWGNL